ncbi:MAG: molecular chaperone DnaK [Gammaproteobacteria bacterium]
MTFDIDASGILNVLATDKAQSIVIRATSGLDEAEINHMVADAETHADEDRKFHELVDARNQAGNLVHSVCKQLGERLTRRIAA